jgi:hypothetical protein
MLCTLGVLLWALLLRYRNSLNSPPESLPQLGFSLTLDFGKEKKKNDLLMMMFPSLEEQKVSSQPTQTARKVNEWQKENDYTRAKR